MKSRKNPAIPIGIVACSMLAGVPGIAEARGASAYLPLNMSPEIERQVERLMLLADRPVMKRPIAVAAVLDALPAGCSIDPALCERVRRYLDAYAGRAAVTHASVEVAATRDSTKTLPNRHGLLAEDNWAASAQGLLRAGDYALVQAGGLAYPGSTTATGSWLSVGYEYAQLDIGYRDHWWSPMTDSAMLIGTQAPTMPGITLSNYQPISRWGFQYELYAARMSHVDDIHDVGRTTAGYPRIAGMLLSVEPAPGWSLSVSRLLQFGGGTKTSAIGDYLRAFFNPVKNDNVSDSGIQYQFGNQVAAVGSRFLFPTRQPFSVYFEYAGEDGSRSEGWRLGNVALSAGLDIPRLWNRFDLTYEVSDWQNAWYVNGVYPEGTSNKGHVIGHWAGDDRLPRDAVGGQSHSLRLGWELQSGDQMQLRYRTLQNEDYSGHHYRREHDVALRYSQSRRNFVLGGEVEIGRDVFGEDFGRLGAFLRFVPGQLQINAGEYPDDEEQLPRARKVDVFIDGGMNASRLEYDPSDAGMTPTQTTSSFGPHAGVGARRIMTKSIDLGARVEFDTIDGRSTISARAIDFRYRLGRKFAVTAFAGATRYSGPTAAYGYYGGVGGQWRDVLPQVDLSVDFRGTDKVARDRLLPSDPATTWGDMVYRIYSASLYLSYRFQ
jgi:hypothetical protein